MVKTGSIVLIYGILVFAGGLLGHFKSQSLPSLISGVVFGVLLILSAFAMMQKKDWGWWIALILAFLLDGFFTWRFVKTLKLFPAGIMSLVSLIMVILLALRMNGYYKKRS